MSQPSAAAQPNGGDANAPAPMKDIPAQGNPGAKGKGKRDVLGGDPNNVPRAIDEDSKRPAARGRGIGHGEGDALDLQRAAASAGDG